MIAHFHVRPGCVERMIDALRIVGAATRAEPGCLDYKALQSRRDPNSFFVQSAWIDETAFEMHAEADHTVGFVETVQTLIERPFEISRLDQVI